MPPLSAIFSPASRMRLRRFRWIHAPLTWVNRTLFPALHQTIVGVGRQIIPKRFWFGPARGWFSDYQALLSSNPVRESIILENQGNPKLPEPSIMLLCKRTQHLQQPWPVFWRYYKNVRLIGSSLVHLNERRELAAEAAYHIPKVPEDSAWLYWPFKRPLELQGSWTSIISRWLPVRGKSPYAHWLLDALPRLELLKHFPADTKVLIPNDLYPAQIESLKLLGIWDRCRRTTETHLRIEHFYFSSPPSMIVCHSPYTVERLRAAFLPRIAKDMRTPKRFFIRRTSYGRNMTNEREVLDFFEKLGWTVVDTASLGFAEQVQWFAGAEAICAIHGSGTANMVWCSPGTKFIEMFAADYLAGDQEWIAQCVQVDYHFMIFPCDYKLDATIDLAVLRDKLAKLDLL